MRCTISSTYHMTSNGRYSIISDGQMACHDAGIREISRKSCWFWLLIAYKPSRISIPSMVLARQAAMGCPCRLLRRVQPQACRQHWCPEFCWWRYTCPTCRCPILRFGAGIMSFNSIELLLVDNLLTRLTLTTSLIYWISCKQHRRVVGQCWSLVTSRNTMGRLAIVDMTTSRCNLATAETASER